MCVFGWNNFGGNYYNSIDDSSGDFGVAWLNLRVFKFVELIATIGLLLRVISSVG